MWDLEQERAMPRQVNGKKTMVITLISVSQPVVQGSLEVRERGVWKYSRLRRDTAGE